MGVWLYVCVAMSIFGWDMCRMFVGGYVCWGVGMCFGWGVEGSGGEGIYIKVRCLWDVCERLCMLECGCVYVRVGYVGGVCASVYFRCGYMGVSVGGVCGGACVGDHTLCEVNYPLTSGPKKSYLCAHIQQGQDLADWNNFFPLISSVTCKQNPLQRFLPSCINSVSQGQ